MTPDPFQTVPTPIARDRWGRPLIVPPGKQTPIGYTRCTTYVGVLEDTYNLSRWEQRMVTIGLTMRPDLLIQATSERDSKDVLNDVCDKAKDVGTAYVNKTATVGTALHKLAENHDRGLDIGPLPPEYVADMDAYRRIVEPFTFHHIEQMCVNDERSVAGTPDRVAEHNGKLRIVDLKTGSIEWGILKICMQLAMYANSVPYYHETQARHPWHPELEMDLETATVIHLPAGSGNARLVDVDIRQGWDAVQTAGAVRAWRKLKLKDLTSEFSHTPQTELISTDQVRQAQAMSPELASAFGVDGNEQARIQQSWSDWLADKIATASTVDELTGLWPMYHHIWTEQHTTLAKARRTLLESSMV